MGSLSTYARNKLLDHVFGNTAYSNVDPVYLALCTSEVVAGDDGSTIDEANYTSYTRKAITFGNANLTSRNITQSGAISFPKATGGSSTVTHYAVLDSATIGAGNILGYGALTLSKSIVTNNTPNIADGQVVITAASTGGIANYGVQKMLDFMFRNQTFTQPTLYCGLTTATVVNTDTGSTVTEVSGADYARVTSLSFGVASSATLSNDVEIDLGTAGTGGWGTITSVIVTDASTAGNLLFYDNDNVTDQLVSAGDPVSIPVGNFDATLS